MISKEKLRQRIAPQKHKPDVTALIIQGIEWKVSETLGRNQEMHRLLSGLAQHLGFRSY